MRRRNIKWIIVILLLIFLITLGFMLFGDTTDTDKNDGFLREPSATQEQMENADQDDSTRLEDDTVLPEVDLTEVEDEVEEKKDSQTEDKKTDAEQKQENQASDGVDDKEQSDSDTENEKEKEKPIDDGVIHLPKIPF